MGQLGDGLVAPLLGPSHPGQGPAVRPAAEPRREGPQAAVVAGPLRPPGRPALQLWNTAAGLVPGCTDAFPAPWFNVGLSNDKGRWFICKPRRVSQRNGLACLLAGGDQEVSEHCLTSKALSEMCSFSTPDPELKIPVHGIILLS